MKYRMLTDEELRHLEEDLKHFLIVHGVHDTQWEAMNRDEPEHAIELVGVFSDTVLQKVYEKLEFLEFRSEDACLVFQCKKESQDVIAINRKSGAAVDLSTIEGIHAALTHSAADLTFFRSTKEYTQTREEEIHQLVENGCMVSSREFWEALEKVLV
jgi:glutaredoxin 2